MTLVSSAPSNRSSAAPVRLQRYARNPVLSPDPSIPTQAIVTTNPGAWYDQERQQVLMLYRTSGNEPEHRVHLALAASSNGYDFERLGRGPVFGPSEDGFDAGCVEDPRMVKIGDWYYVTYAARPFPPGRYWMSPKERAYQPPHCPPDFPWALRFNATSTGLALTKDFKTWIRAGRLSRPEVDDRDVILFPEKINGRFYLLHRPMNWVGAKYGTEHPAMWISSGEDVLAMTDSRLLAKAEFDWEHKIGGNTPPIRTKQGWLHIYHAVGPDKHYRLGAMLLDLDDPSIVRYRTKDWILQPEQKYELEGYYPGVVFPCGAVILGETFFCYYGGADKYVGVATCPVKDLLDYLLNCPVK